jgi:hypothetical protein
MLIDPEDIAARYAKMNDNDLLKFAQTYDSLTGSAQALLRAEFAHRRLDPPVIDDAPPATLRKLVTIRRYRDLSEAIVARSLLEAAGIPVFLRDENLVRLEWQISNFIGGIRLQVEDTNEYAATEILDQPSPDTIPFGEEDEFEQPRCPRCGSLDIRFEGAARGAALASLYVASLPLPLGRPSWRCDACGARWEEIEENVAAPSDEGSTI